MTTPPTPARATHTMTPTSTTPHRTRTTLSQPDHYPTAHQSTGPDHHGDAHRGDGHSSGVHHQSGRRPHDGHEAGGRPDDGHEYGGQHDRGHEAGGHWIGRGHAGHPNPGRDSECGQCGRGRTGRFDGWAGRAFERDHDRDHSDRDCTPKDPDTVVPAAVELQPQLAGADLDEFTSCPLDRTTRAHPDARIHPLALRPPTATTGAPLRSPELTHAGQAWTIPTAAATRHTGPRRSCSPNGARADRVVTGTGVSHPCPPLVAPSGTTRWPFGLRAPARLTHRPRHGAGRWWWHRVGVRWWGVAAALVAWCAIGSVSPPRAAVSAGPPSATASAALRTVSVVTSALPSRDPAAASASAPLTVPAAAPSAVPASVLGVISTPRPSERGGGMALAQPGPDGTGQLTQVITNIRNWLLGLLVSLATLYLTLGGVRYLLAGGDPGEVDAAKRAFKSAAIGYALAALAPALVAILRSLVGA